MSADCSATQVPIGLQLAARDQALVRLMFDLGLRRASVVSLDVEHVDLAAGKLLVLLKGRTQRSWLSLPAPTRERSGPGCTTEVSSLVRCSSIFDRAGKGQRLTGRSLHRIVQRLGADLGIVTRPHGLRHTAITEALEVMGGNVRAVQKFAGHADVRVIERYDDARQDLAGEVARKVAEQV